MDGIRCCSRKGGDVVPFDLAMQPDERTLLVSGPNTGGKTVLLKALGLISALAQSGVPAPVGPGSRVAMFDDAFADVGDEQSIEASLSTFSAHLKNLAEILRLATADSLVLIDELGSGTDPIEGAALGWAILESLTARGTMTARDDAPRHAQGAGVAGRRRGQRVAAVRRCRARADLSSDQGHSRPLVRHRDRAPPPTSRRRRRIAPKSGCRSTSATSPR